MNKKRLLKYILVSLLILLFVVSLGYNARNYIKETLVETYNNGYRIGVNDIATNIKIMSGLDFFNTFTLIIFNLCSVGMIKTICKINAIATELINIKSTTLCKLHVVIYFCPFNNVNNVNFENINNPKLNPITANILI